MAQKGPMPGRRQRKERPPLDRDSLSAIALRYVERFATTRSKLASYLKRKVRERGWGGAEPPPIEALVERFASSGYVDDKAYALSKSRSLSARGYGTARVRQTLRAAGVEEEDAAPAKALADEQAVEAAVRFARRRRIGPFAATTPDRDARRKAIAAMARAGHGLGLAIAIVDLSPGDDVDIEVMIKMLSRDVESV